jgi:hypothetical protein
LELGALSLYHATNWLTGVLEHINDAACWAGGAGMRLFGTSSHIVTVWIFWIFWIRAAQANTAPGRQFCP